MDKIFLYDSMDQEFVQDLLRWGGGWTSKTHYGEDYVTTKQDENIYYGLGVSHIFKSIWARIFKLKIKDIANYSRLDVVISQTKLPSGHWATVVTRKCNATCYKARACEWSTKAKVALAWDRLSAQQVLSAVCCCYICWWSCWLHGRLPAHAFGLSLAWLSLGPTPRPLRDSEYPVSSNSTVRISRMNFVLL